MIYEKEFRLVKEVYQQLSPAAREIAGLMATLPLASVLLYGGVLGGLGVIGFGGVAAIGVVTTAAAVAGVAYTVDLERELQPWLEAKAGSREAEAVAQGLALKKRAEEFLKEKFAKTFAEAVSAAPATASAASGPDPAPVVTVAQAPAMVVQLSGSGGAFNPVAVRMLSVSNGDAKPRAVKPGTRGGGTKAKSGKAGT
ncbi:MAG: hypothetical protein GC185_13495 [Alphaproteobacteria bacterium]|nr:hypothetical protein [Alphaproteobacteria bacterium]